MTIVDLAPPQKVVAIASAIGIIRCMNDTEITIRTDLRPGDLGRIVSLHGTAYIDDVLHFGLTFEAFVGRTIAEFIIDNEGRGKVFLAERGDELVACAAIVERREGDRLHGQLRWILADPSVRGLGLGRKLVDMAMDHARTQGWDSVFLETTEGLDASMKIYETLGFEVESRTKEKLWRDAVDVITMRLSLGSAR